MKALTICQPYACFIALPETDCRKKRVENRTWETLYRGELLIHAGKSKQWLDTSDISLTPEEESGLMFGAMVAVAKLADCVHITELTAYAARTPERGWLIGHLHTGGPFLWVLENVRKLATPVPCQGAQGLWQPNPVVLDNVKKQLAGAR